MVSMTKRTRYLAKGQVLGAALNGSLRVTCDSGVLWVTAPGSGDLLLSGGASVRLRGPGKVVVQALEPARFGLEPLAREGTGSAAEESQTDQTSQESPNAASHERAGDRVERSQRIFGR